MNKSTGILCVLVAIVPLISCNKENTFSKTVVDLSKAGRANCYVVSSPGKYIFEAANSSDTFNASSADVIWESFGTSQAPKVGDVVKDVTLKDGYVHFSTPKKLNNGNAVVVIRDNDEKILWSWHIWVCKGFDPAASAQTYINDAGVMMDRNLGATSAVPGNAQALGLLYQWGRKDPFPGSCSISADELSAATEQMSSRSGQESMQFAVEHPYMYISGSKSSGYDWIDKSDDELWTDTGRKSVYDPCPAGWRVPHGKKNSLENVWTNALGYLSDFKIEELYDSERRGVLFTSDNTQMAVSGGVWYPLAGDGFDGLALDNVGIMSSWWSASTEDDDACVFRIYWSGTIQPAAPCGRGSASSVRCMKDWTI